MRATSNPALSGSIVTVAKKRFGEGLGGGFVGSGNRRIGPVPHGCGVVVSPPGLSGAGSSVWDRIGAHQQASAGVADKPALTVDDAIVGAGISVETGRVGVVKRLILERLLQSAVQGRKIAPLRCTGFFGRLDAGDRPGT